MPNFDGGHYFLTALIPIMKGQIEDDPGVFTSPVHAMRKLLALLPASPTLRFPTDPSPFERVPGLHFARLVIVDDVAYNGRVGIDTILGKIKKINPVVAQHQDHLPRPYLILAMDFDAPDGRDLSRDAFLKGMWEAMPQEIAMVLQYAVGFDKMRPDGNGFATYIAECQIETTMSFNDYYIDSPVLPDWTKTLAAKIVMIVGIAGVVAVAIGLLDLLAALIWPHLVAYGLVFLLLGLLIVAGAVGFAYAAISKQGSEAFPTDPRTTLPNILKALHLQRAFVAFTIANQANAARDAGEAALHEAFGDFLAAQQPANLQHPTQPPGVLGL